MAVRSVASIGLMESGIYSFNSSLSASGGSAFG